MQILHDHGEVFRGGEDLSLSDSLLSGLSELLGKGIRFQIFHFEFPFYFTNVSGIAHRVDHRLTPASCPQTFPHPEGVEKSMDNFGQPYGRSLRGDRRAAPRRGGQRLSFPGCCTLLSG